MKKTAFNLIILAFLLAGCSHLSEEEKSALRKHLSHVEYFENSYSAKLKGVKGREEFVILFNNARLEAGDLVTDSEALQKQYPGLRGFRVNIRRLPADFRDSYYKILEIRRDISKTEYDLMVKFKAKELDTPEVFRFGNSIKKSVFILDF